MKTPILMYLMALEKSIRGIRSNTTLLFRCLQKPFAKMERFSKPIEYNKLCSSQVGNSINISLQKKSSLLEGFGALRIPILIQECWLPRKGEYVTFKSPELQLDKIVKGPYLLFLGREWSLQDRSYPRQKRPNASTYKKARWNWNRP